jgi:hypothetical protein
VRVLTVAALKTLFLEYVAGIQYVASVSFHDPVVFTYHCNRSFVLYIYICTRVFVTQELPNGHIKGASIKHENTIAFKFNIPLIINMVNYLYAYVLFYACILSCAILWRVELGIR